jgi:ABC-type glycerol-3-phosphate transport system permease component
MGIKSGGKIPRSIRPLGVVLLWVVAIALLVVMVFPILWMLLAAFKTDNELFLNPPPFFPRKPTLEAFQYLFTSARYMRMMLNSYVLAIMVTGVGLVLASLAAYGFSRFDIPGKGSILLVTLVLQMFPGVSLIIPYYNIMRSIGLYDTYAGLLVADASFVLPFSIWMLKSYLDTIPIDLEEAAMVDGASRLVALVRVVVPLTAPGMIATGTYVFLSTWNEYMFASILTRGGDFAPITVGIGEFFGLFTVRWSQMSALSALASVPLMLAFVFLQRYLVEGMTAGAVK